MFQCDQCNKTCSNKSNLIRHLQLHQRDTFDCECGDNFNTKQALLEHKKKHQDDRPYNCTENGCTKTFASVSGLWSHKRRVHRMSIEDGKNKCEVCDKIFGQKGHLQDHMLTHYDVKEFQCDLCKKKFKFQRNVARHRKNCLKKRGMLSKQ
ncbi:zinc finger protein 320-like [Mytilus trossulus]|uniref:zinc finger protein 320-like n=1 Tax=Mytilus trossulus TaxID=6551 RepID=UPI0030040E23